MKKVIEIILMIRLLFDLENQLPKTAVKVVSVWEVILQKVVSLANQIKQLEGRVLPAFFILPSIKFTEQGTSMSYSQAQALNGYGISAQNNNGYGYF